MNDRSTMAAQDGAAKRWCFTINNPTDDDMFWEDAEQQEKFDFLAVQYEVGKQGTPHYQGFVILKRRNRLTWLKSNFNNRAHWEKTRGTDLEAAQYCMKDDTHPPGSYRWRWGTLKECQKRRSREELEETVIEEVDELKKKFKPAAEINSQVLARPGFLAAYNALTADMLGVYRPNLKIVTMVGPPGTGKSFAINKLFPKAGRAIIGNGGTWFANPTATVMVFEEFAGQIPLQKMLKLLDPYPMALEVKGGMRPAMYTLAIITSNTRPDGWYKNEEQDGKRSDALLALWDRLGFSNGTNRCYRTCGTYLEPVRGMALGATGTWIDNTRTWFMNELAKAADMQEHEELSDEALSQVEQDKLEDDIASLDIGDGNTAPSPSQ
ncbi:replication associated protein [Hudisavirus sp.]|nr:replication associated protein [Hudisavirus sp.]